MKAAAFGSILFLLAGMVGCGNIGPPIAPEDVGIRAKVLRAQRLEQNRKEAPDVPPSEQPTADASQEGDIQLRPTRPVGTR